MDVDVLLLRRAQMMNLRKLQCFSVVFSHPDTIFLDSRREKQIRVVET